MRECFLFVSVFLCINAGLKAQTPGGINYQGVAQRSTWPFAVNSKLITLRFTVREKTPMGASVYTEVRNATTDSFGVFSVVIGAAGAVSQSGDIKKVPWSDTTKKFLQVELDIYDPVAPGFVNMGTTQLLSVPFSFYSDVSDSTRISDSSRISRKADSSRYANGSGRYFFSATISPNFFQSLPNDDDFNYIVKFPTVTENEGNVLNPTTSVFTAPDSGYYVFNVTGVELFSNNEPQVLDNYFESVLIALMKNNTVVKLLHSESTSVQPNLPLDRQYQNRSFNHHVMLKLAKNDQVTVRINAYYTGFSSYVLGFFPPEFDFINPVAVDNKAFAEFSGYKIK
ncbi:MAG: hypothetical protein EAY75_05935 [Bacteroidetes bacterium]|nr:MAG: hypothetical protein EAY75_05935 [Bacteroidota bacterium]